MSSITSLPFPESILSILISNGYTTINEMKSLNSMELIEMGISKDLTKEVMEYLSTHNTNDNNTSTSLITSNVISIKDILLKQKSYKPIITFCKSLDTILGGGILLGQITELCGIPNIGKTQLAIQLAIDVQIPHDIFHGTNGNCLYIDTEGSLMIERVVSMSKAVSNHLQKVLKLYQQKNNMKSISSDIINAITFEKFLQGITVYRIHDQTELIAWIHQLDNYIQKHQDIKLIVIDSIAFHFRQGLQENLSRSRILSNIAQILHDIAYKYHIAIVVTNHVTTRFETSSISHIVPALGEQWSHCITNRIMLHWDNNDVQTCLSNNLESILKSIQRKRFATLVKSPNRPKKTAEYQILEIGVRDVQSNHNEIMNTELHKKKENEDADEMIHKRQKIKE